VWFWDGREVGERAWVFLADAADNPRLSRGQCPELVEADGQRFKTFWRPIDGKSVVLPALRPSAIAEMLCASLVD
jgi:hypothetical protein